MASTEGRVARLERRWGCRRGAWQRTMLHSTHKWPTGLGFVTWAELKQLHQQCIGYTCAARQYK